MMDNMVRLSPNLIYCLGKNCDLTFKVEEKFLTDKFKLPQHDGVCNCGTVVCLKCKQAGHMPLSCEMFSEWDKNL